MKQIPLAIGTDATPSFDSFLSGANGAALAHLRSLAPGAAPVYLWGPAGSGKTHLLQAAAREWQAHGGRAVGFDADEPLPWKPEQGASLFVLDDCDAFDSAQQQAAFGLFIEAGTHGATILAAGRMPPVDLPLRDDLRSRLGWGHVYALTPLTEAETRAALRREADRRGIFLSDEVMDYLLTRFARDLKHLMSILDRLDEFSLAHKRAVTVPLLKQMLVQEEGPA
jgi:DnaA-homolog protein